MDSIEKKAADDNTVLQLKGAAKQMRAAADALTNALTLGGNAAGDGALADMFAALHRLQQLAVVTGYRHKVPFDDIAESLHMPTPSALLLLGKHFQDEPLLANRWLLAEQEIQQRIGPGETLADKFPGGARR